jgi:ATP-dependent Clp protease ATP-binding subunit ClpA
MGKSKPITSITNFGRLKELLEGQSNQGKSRQIDAETLKQRLQDRVKGQDHVIADLVDHIQGSWAMRTRKQPIGSFLFLGAPGVGKTELAKALAEALYENEKALLRIDMGQVPPGDAGMTYFTGVGGWYANAKEGSSLINQVISNGERVVLIDEIEKAEAKVLQLFLTMLDEGYMTDARGNRADFTRAVIIFTSNEGFKECLALQQQSLKPEDFTKAITEILCRRHFSPEFLDRVSQIHVFNLPDPETRAQIVLLKVRGFVEDYGLELDWIDEELVLEFVTEADKLQSTRALRSTMQKKLGGLMIRAQAAGWKNVRIVRDGTGKPDVRPSLPLVTLPVILGKLQQLARAYQVQLEEVDSRLLDPLVQECNGLPGAGEADVERVVRERFEGVLAAVRDEGLRKVRLGVDAQGTVEIDPLP